ncbi:MAG: hypothetical protein GXO19_01130 [Epsilonproteobacteria bacterium]|nr:hypothetical protein [Campylobacterota bacterium]NPA56317.1 hypothetical protein [Campylobacterota bacterium]
MWEKFLDKIIDYLFDLPKYPMRFRELMEANRVYLDHLDIKQIPGIRYCRLKLYFIYFIIWNLILIPLSLLFHSFLSQMDCHVAIVLAIIFTLLFFGTYKIFEERLKERAALRVIKEAWHNYLPHFPYERYREKVAQIYKEAIDRDIPKKKIEQFIIDRIVESK